MSFKEKVITSSVILVALAAFVFWIGSFYVNLTRPIPKKGGAYIEGIVGQPLYLNPLLSQTSEADSDLTQLIYSGLFKYDKNGEVVADLAENYSITDDGRTYTVNLKKNITWQDGTSLTAKDIFFTYNILQDPAYKSPLRQNLQGVSVDMIDDYTLVFSLKNPYVGFLENLTVGILPKHVWENIAPEKFALAEYNLHPIGSGPYMFTDLQKDAGGNILTLTLSAFKNYSEGLPYISKITFNFYPDDDDLLAAYNKKEIMGIGSLPPGNIAALKNLKSTDIHELIIPRYFAVFFNQTKNVALANDDVRKALNMSVSRQEIIQAVLHGKGTALTSPFFPQMDNYSQQTQVQEDLAAANAALDQAGWKLDPTEKIRKKGQDKLEFELVTTDWPELNQTAQLLKTQWEKVGAKVNVKILTVSDLQQNYIRPREYDALLFGQAISFNPDLYSFWHSSQKRDPGLNLSLFDNKDADGILENVRQETDQDKRKAEYAQLQTILAKENPAVFLYGRTYLYPVSTAVKGMEVKNINNPQQRFADVNKWYINTSRVFK